MRLVIGYSSFKFPIKSNFFICFLQLCVLNSPAINCTLMLLTATAETIKQSKLLQEEQEMEVENEISTQHGESMTIDQKVYSSSDYVYYDV